MSILLNGIAESKHTALQRRLYPCEMPHFHGQVPFQYAKPMKMWQFSWLWNSVIKI